MEAAEVRRRIRQELLFGWSLIVSGFFLLVLGYFAEPRGGSMLPYALPMILLGGYAIRAAQVMRVVSERAFGGQAPQAAAPDRTP